VLGLPHLYTFGDLAFFQCGDTRLFLSAGTEASQSRNHSVIYFEVPEIGAAFDALTAKGVSFLGAPHMIHRHPDGTEEWMAFFEDGLGNTLALMSKVKSAT
jgi:methylmalonyl-CoA/ethylmalonyl-CoA epimerase